MDNSRGLIIWEQRPSPLGRIIRAGTQWNFPWWSQKWRRLDHFALVYILEGSCSFLAPGTPEQRITAGTMFKLLPGEPHFYGPTPGIPTSQTFIDYDGPVFRPWHMPGLLGPECFTIDLRPVNYWLERFESAVSAFPPGDGSNPRGICALQSLFAEIVAYRDGRSHSAEGDRWLRLATAAIEAVPRADLLDMRAVAEQLDMSYANFRKRFTKLAQTSPVKFHTRVLMQRARQILMSRKISDRDLSEQLGYNDPYAFAMHFRRVFSMSPHEFRRSMSEWRDQTSPEGRVVPGS